MLPHLSLALEKRKKAKAGHHSTPQGGRVGDVRVGMWSPAAQGTVPTAQQTCGVGGVGAGPFLGAHKEFCAVGWVLGCTLRARSIPLPGDLDSAGSLHFL